jgi:hypothetical protein
MRKHSYLYTVGALLIAASALAYWIHYLIFHDPHHIFIYLLGDVAFVPLEVLLVVIVLERLLHSHEKQALMDKLNMVIGTFFSELGTELLGELTPAVADQEETLRRLAVRPEWAAQDFAQAHRFARAGDLALDSKQLDLGALRKLLADKREFLVRLLENPNLLEHERFSDLLWAVFHLGEELVARESLEELPESDLEHLSGDLARVYTVLAIEWIAYAQHLQAEYPFLFSLLVRTHPLQAAPEAVIR